MSTSQAPQQNVAESPWQELAVRLADAQSGPAEHQQVQARLQDMQARLRAQADVGLPAGAYAQLQATRQAVDAALHIMAKLPPVASPGDGPAQTPVSLKGESK